MTPPTPNSDKSKFEPPSIVAKSFARTIDRGSVQLVTKDEQDTLTKISRTVEFRRNTVIYREGGRSQFVYNIISGVAETYYLQSGGKRRVTSFLFPSDLLGLRENGEYVARAQVMTPLIAYPANKIRYDALRPLVHRDPLLEAAPLSKLCHELRQSGRHVITSVQNDSQASVASFVLLLWRSELPYWPPRIT